MKLYEIEQEILACIDAETGEIIDFDRLSELQIAKEEKLESVALWIKNLNAESAAYKAEKDVFAEREKQAKAKAESLKKWLADALNGEPMTTTKVSVTFRKSESVEIEDPDTLPKKWMRVKYEPDKTMIKEAIKTLGKKIKGCSVVVKQNIQIK